MNPQQRTAINHPCEQPEQCSHVRYRKWKDKQGYRLTTVLTVNVGEE